MIFLEYVGSRACLSARLIEYSPVEFILWDFFLCKLFRKSRNFLWG